MWLLLLKGMYTATYTLGNNLLLTECEGLTGEILARGRSSTIPKYGPEQVRLVSCLSFGFVSSSDQNTSPLGEFSYTFRLFSEL